ncbi:MAG: Serine/threonine-protein kinase PknD [bacterium]|nr:Serine/threonine-protein kinase PknD [bacterium]
MPTVEETTSSNRLQQLLYTLGRAYLQKEQYAEAFDKFKQLLAMDADNADILLDTAIAALGLNEASAPTLELYEKAVTRNPNSTALKFGLASLFVHQNITTPFAVELCQSVAELAPANEQQLRLFLKNYYAAAGLADKARAEEQKAIFNSHDVTAIRIFLEKLWWEGKFAEAVTALQTAPKANGNLEYMTRALAMTQAYEALAAGHRLENFDTIKTILAAAPTLQPAESIVDLRDYLVLRLSLLQGEAPAPSLKSKNEAVFAATPFDLCAELLNPLPKPAGTQAEQAPSTTGWRGFLLAQVLKYDGSEVPERLSHLLNTHLAELPNTVLRLAGTTVISLAPDPILQIRAMVDFMQSLEDYNTAVPEAERVMLVGGLQVTPQTHQDSDRETLAALVDAAHLLRLAVQYVTPESGVGTLLLRSEEAEGTSQPGAGFTLMPMAAVQLLPGRTTNCTEVVWRNPLSQLKPGQVCTFGRFEVRKRLLKHNSYGTYLAHDLQLDRPMIMKVMLPAEAAPILQNPERREQLYARLRAIARLSHPQFAFLYDMGEHEGMMFFGREYIEGKNLTELNFRDEQRDGEILAMLQKIVRALIYANSKGVMHLNLKPGNIWLSEAQELRITDFRMTGFVDDGTNSSVLFPAHWRYLAPEILFGENGDARSDIYSLGIIAYELLAGKHPYNTTGSIQSPKDLAKARIAPLHEQERPHHRAWDDFVMRATQREADRRFADLTAMDQELRAIQMEMLKRALNSGR